VLYIRAYTFHVFKNSSATKIKAVGSSETAACLNIALFLAQKDPAALRLLLQPCDEDDDDDDYFLFDI
jgi:hypothetical protein